MMSSISFLFILSVFNVGIAKLQINIKPASSRFGVQIKYAGSEDKLITSKDISTFNITDDNLKQGFNRELGKQPDDVFLSDPTPYGNLFEKYKWKESQRRIKIRSAEVHDIINQNIVMKKHNYINNTTNEILTKVNVYEGVENTMYSSWSLDGMPEEDISISVLLDFGAKQFPTVSKWRHDNYKAFPLLFGSSPGIIRIGAGKTALATLSATKTILILKIVYTARLTGLIVGNYGALYGKYHFWAPTIDNIIKAAKLKNEILTTELIEVKCYTDPKIYVYDKDTREELKVTRPENHFFSLKKKRILDKL